jgi:hypothetical protein
MKFLDSGDVPKRELGQGYTGTIQLESGPAKLLRLYLFAGSTKAAYRLLLTDDMVSFPSDGRLE